MFVEEMLRQLDLPIVEQPATGAAELPDPTAPRIAIYENNQKPPRVISIDETRLPDLIDTLATETYDLARQQGGRVPYGVLRELVENLLHAAFADVVITILDQGNTIRISDRGPGIAEKDSAVRPGFTTADGVVKRFARGVGSGLPRVREALTLLHGHLEIEDNLGRGTVVTIHVPHVAPAPPALPASPAPRAPQPTTPLSDRQLRVLLVCVELGSVGPTRVAHELHMSASTAYRDLVALEAAGFVVSDSAGLRTATDEALVHLKAVL